MGSDLEVRSWISVKLVTRKKRRCALEVTAKHPTGIIHCDQQKPLLVLLVWLSIETPNPYKEAL